MVLYIFLLHGAGCVGYSSTNFQQHVFHDSQCMRHISVRFVPRLLSNDQKAICDSACWELKQQARDDPNFISSIITGHETWVYGYDPETKQQLL